MKKIILLIVVSFSLLSTSAFASFKDISADHLFYESISWMEMQGVVVGYDDGSFKPNQNVSRAEFLKMLYLNRKMYGGNKALPFPDLDMGAWYVPYISEAYNAGVINGYPDGTFRPNDPINFAEAVKIVTNAFFDVPSWYNSSEYKTCMGVGLDQRPSIDTSKWYWKNFFVADNFCLLSFDSKAHVWKNGNLVDYNPSAYVSRDNMVELLYRAKAVFDSGEESPKMTEYYVGLVPAGIISTGNMPKAADTCTGLGGKYYLDYSKLEGEVQVFCKLSTSKVCTQSELVNSQCSAN